jgi:flavin reductase (DIM6/NTAB) family NADH-FMN oxidoreductase RutF
VSLDPPLIAFLPAATSSSWPKIAKAGRFCVNVLAADQESVCRSFAARSADKFAGLSWHAAPSGAPILDGALAWIDCGLETVHEAGDHLIVLGRVSDLHIERSTLPLLFFQGGYGRFSPHSLAARDARFATQLQIVDRARPLMEQLADRTGTQVGAAFCDGNELTILASAGAAPDLQLLPAAIGHRLPVHAPVGIWWAANAAAEQAEGWLRDITPPELAERYRGALKEIRESGLCLGLAPVHTEMEKVVDARTTPGVEPTAEERQALGRLALDPHDFVPSATALAELDRRSDVVSLWAPTFTADGDVGLGLFLSGSSHTGRPAHTYAAELRALAQAVTTLAAS